MDWGVGTWWLTGTVGAAIVYHEFKMVDKRHHPNEFTWWPSPKEVVVLVCLAWLGPFITIAGVLLWLMFGETSKPFRAWLDRPINKWWNRD